MAASLLAAALFLATSHSPAVQPLCQAEPDARASFEARVRSALSDRTQVVTALLEGGRLLPALAADEARRVGDTLQPFAERAFFGPERFPGMERLGLTEHEVRTGENPSTIAARYDVGLGLLELLNRDLDARRLRVGQRLKVLDLSHGELSIEVDRGLWRLVAWRQLAEGGRVPVLFVPVGLGAPDSPTPVGRTCITQRVLDPEWTDPASRKVHAPGSPGNVLGGYWIALDPGPLGRGGIGIHGYTGAPSRDWIEQRGSHGCVRLLQADIARLYHVATEGTPVELR